MLVEMLPENEKKGFMSYTASYMDVGFYACKRAPVEKILSEWDCQKSEYLWDIMQHNFILKKVIDVNKDEEELFTEMDSGIRSWYSKGFKFFRAWEDAILTYCDTNFFLEKVSIEGEKEELPYPSNRYRDNSDRLTIYKTLTSLMQVPNLVSNTYTGAPLELPLPNGKTVTLSNGCKVSKFICKFYTKLKDLFNCSDEDMENWRLAHSQVLNEKTIKGTLCLSIHPLDFVTASDNECDWSSCMSWVDDGEYHRGTVEMMNSPMVVCAYLEDKDPMDAGGIDWSNKRWREFFIVRDDMVAGIKGYPFWNRELEATTIKWLAELVEEAKFNRTPFADEILTYKYNKFMHEEGSNYPKFTTDRGAMYNDFYSDNTYQVLLVEDFEDTGYIKYNGNATCMNCGEVMYYDDFACDSSTCCHNCSSVERCICCDGRYDSEDMHELDGELICDDCYYEQPISILTDERHLESNTVYMRIFDTTTDTIHDYTVPVGDMEDWEKASFPIYKIRYHETWRSYDETTEDYGIRLEDIINDKDNEIWQYLKNNFGFWDQSGETFRKNIENKLAEETVFDRMYDLISYERYI